MFGATDGVINEQASVSNLLGISPGSARLSGYEGAGLPASTFAGSDRAAVPWSTDSPLLWGGAIALLTLLGIVGASVNVRAGKARAGVEVNDG
jgi:hypothetical protein